MLYESRQVFNFQTAYDAPKTMINNAYSISKNFVIISSFKCQYRSRDGSFFSVDLMICVDLILLVCFRTLLCVFQLKCVFRELFCVPLTIIVCQKATPNNPIQNIFYDYLVLL